MWRSDASLAIIVMQLLGPIGENEFCYSRTALNPYLSADGSSYGLWVTSGQFGFKFSYCVEANKYGLWGCMGYEGMGKEFD